MSLFTPHAWQALRTFSVPFVLIRKKSSLENPILCGMTLAAWKTADESVSAVIRSSKFVNYVSLDVWTYLRIAVFIFRDPQGEQVYVVPAILQEVFDDLVRQTTITSRHDHVYLSLSPKVHLHATGVCMIWVPFSWLSTSFACRGCRQFQQVEQRQKAAH